MPHQLVWLILLLPVFSFIVISFLIRPLVKPESRVAGYITIAALGSSLALSIWALIAVMATPHHELPMPDISWLVIESGITIRLGLMMDSLTAIMMVVVTTVSLMV